MIKVVLADDHALVRSGIRSLLETVPDMDIVGEASNGLEAVDVAIRTGADVLVMDVSMPEMNGIAATRTIKTAAPETRVLLVTMHSSDRTVRSALSAGADGYFLKDSGPAELGEAIRAVANGLGYLSPSIAARRQQGLLEPTEDDVLLTQRQLQVLQLVAEGHSTKTVARKLEISPKTVENHRAQIMDRLGVRGLPALMRYAIAEGLIGP